MTWSFPARPARALLAAGAALWLMACGGGEGGTEPNVPPTTGGLVLSVSGLPTGLVPAFELTAANGSTRSVSAGDTIRNLPAGLVTVRPSSPSAPGIGRWVPFRESYDVTVIAGTTVSESVQFAAAQIILTTETVGLPQTAIASVRYTAPDGTVFSTTAGAPFVTSSAGTWRVQGVQVSAADYLWSPVGPAVTRDVLPGDTALASIPYVVTSGALEVTAPGLDTGLVPRFTITQGNLSFSRNGPGIFAELPAGPWQLTATSLSRPGLRWSPAASAQVVSVSTGATSRVSVPYAATQIQANMQVESAYLTQAIQTYDGATPLVAGREAVLRVFLRATEPNDWRPVVRVRLFDGTTPVETLDIPALGIGVDTMVDEGSLIRSWNVSISAARMKPGLRFTVEADPDRSITADSDPADNIWPRSGEPREVTVVPVGTWHAVLVPVVNSASNLQGDVTEANKNQFTNLVRQLLPIAESNVRVREPYTANIAPLQSNDGNGAWLALLNEIRALQVLERTVANEYFYGVVKVNYSSGIAGYGYVPGRAAIGWDYLPSGDGVAAHEWGHNFGRRHAPCGNVGNADSQFPSPTGAIGSWGWQPTTNRPISPLATDLMGYCGNQWISAFNWTGALTYRSGTPNAAVSGAAAISSVATDGVLVWGSIENGRVRLEPSFFVSGVHHGDDARDASDVQLRVEALDASGSVLAATVTSAALVDHATAGARAFAVTLPLTAAQHERLASLRVHDVRSPLAGTTRRREAIQSAAGAARALGAELRVARRAGARARVTWDDARVAGALVRDAATGRVLSILRASGGEIAVPRGDVEVVLSDGVRSRVQRLPVQ
jgi:hypothetical protein